MEEWSPLLKDILDRAKAGHQFHFYRAPPEAEEAAIMVTPTSDEKVSRCKRDRRPRRLLKALGLQATPSSADSPASSATVTPGTTPTATLAPLRSAPRGRGGNSYASPDPPVNASGRPGRSASAPPATDAAASTPAAPYRRGSSGRGRGRRGRDTGLGSGSGRRDGTRDSNGRFSVIKSAESFPLPCSPDPETPASMHSVSVPTPASLALLPPPPPLPPLTTAAAERGGRRRSSRFVGGGDDASTSSESEATTYETKEEKQSVFVAAKQGEEGVAGDSGAHDRIMSSPETPVVRLGRVRGRTRTRGGPAAASSAEAGAHAAMSSSRERADVKLADVVASSSCSVAAASAGSVRANIRDVAEGSAPTSTANEAGTDKKESADYDVPSFAFEQVGTDTKDVAEDGAPISAVTQAGTDTKDVAHDGAPGSVAKHEMKPGERRGPGKRKARLLGDITSWGKLPSSRPPPRNRRQLPSPSGGSSVAGDDGAAVAATTVSLVAAAESTRESALSASSSSTSTGKEMKPDGCERGRIGTGVGSGGGGVGGDSGNSKDEGVDDEPDGRKDRAGSAADKGISQGVNADEKHGGPEEGEGSPPPGFEGEETRRAEENAHPKETEQPEVAGAEADGGGENRGAKDGVRDAGSDEMKGDEGGERSYVSSVGDGTGKGDEVSNTGNVFPVGVGASSSASVKVGATVSSTPEAGVGLDVTGKEKEQNENGGSAVAEKKDQLEDMDMSEEEEEEEEKSEHLKQHKGAEGGGGNDIQDTSKASMVLDSGANDYKGRSRGADETDDGKRQAEGREDHDAATGSGEGVVRTHAARVGAAGNDNGHGAGGASDGAQQAGEMMHGHDGNNGVGEGNKTESLSMLSLSAGRDSSKSEEKLTAVVSRRRGEDSGSGDENDAKESRENSSSVRPVVAPVDSSSAAVGASLTSTDRVTAAPLGEAADGDFAVLDMEQANKEAKDERWSAASAAAGTVEVKATEAAAGMVTTQGRTEETNPVDTVSMLSPSDDTSSLPASTAARAQVIDDNRGGASSALGAVVPGEGSAMDTAAIADDTTAPAGAGTVAIATTGETAGVATGDETQSSARQPPEAGAEASVDTLSPTEATTAVGENAIVGTAAAATREKTASGVGLPHGRAPAAAAAIAATAGVAKSTPSSSANPEAVMACRKSSRRRIASDRAKDAEEDEQRKRKSSSLGGGGWAVDGGDGGDGAGGWGGGGTGASGVPAGSAVPFPAHVDTSLLARPTDMYLCR